MIQAYLKNQWTSAESMQHLYSHSYTVHLYLHYDIDVGFLGFYLHYYFFYITFLFIYIVYVNLLYRTYMYNMYVSFVNMFIFNSVYDGIRLWVCSCTVYNHPGAYSISHFNSIYYPSSRTVVFAIGFSKSLLASYPASSLLLLKLEHFSWKILWDFVGVTFTCWILCSSG